MRHLDPYAQALAKIERGHALDRQDVQAMFERRLIEETELLRLFEAIEPYLFRFPAIDAVSFRTALAQALSARRTSQLN